MRSRHLLLAAALLAASALHAQDAAAVTVLLKKLQSERIETRREAITELQTSLDPRIPDACLPLLDMEGDSIRRLAARAIGSRWHQIPKERVPIFTAALKRQVKGKENDGLGNMARRGLSLLNRDYTGAMVTRSKNKRWAIYERRGLPCLIDSQTMTEELLGFSNDARMLCSYGNSPLTPTVHWHPAKEMVAISMIEDRHHTTVWVWVHGKGLHNLATEKLLAAVLEKGEHAGVASYGDFAAWSGGNLELKLDYSGRKGEEVLSHEARLRWNSASGKLAVVSNKVVP